MEKIKLSCGGDISEGFELAIIQLGYKIIDSCWDDDNNKMNYSVIKETANQQISASLQEKINRLREMALNERVLAVIDEEINSILSTLQEEQKYLLISTSYDGINESLCSEIGSIENVVEFMYNIQSFDEEDEIDENFSIVVIQNDKSLYQFDSSNVDFSNYL